MTALCNLALIALITGPNSSWLHLVQFMPVTRAINAKFTHSHAINYINEKIEYV